MGKSSVLTVRIDDSLRSELESYAKQEKTSISAISETALKRYCEEQRLAQVRRKNRKRALKAFDRYCGAVSHGSLAQNIDEELYGRLG